MDKSNIQFQTKDMDARVDMRRLERAINELIDEVIDLREKLSRIPKPQRRSPYDIGGVNNAFYR